MKTIVSYSGGRDSGALVLELLEGNHPTIKIVDEIIFSDTGSEADETYAYLPYFQQILRERYGREITILSWRNNPRTHFKTLYDYCNEPGNERIPSRMLKWCTDKTKIQPISEYVKAKYPGEAITMCIGFRGDEQKRVARGRNQVKGFTNAFPLADLGIVTREDVYATFDRLGINRAPHSACWFCPFRNIDWFRDYLAVEKPDQYDGLIQLESAINRRRREQGKSTFNLKHKPLETWRVHSEGGTDVL
jgi:3''-phosphoadenosine 5''-phosphosulfate sulfotransferase (PAPS reductase)/FAD synthetase and related enzymes